MDAQLADDLDDRRAGPACRKAAAICSGEWRFRTGKASRYRIGVLPIFRESRVSRIRGQGQSIMAEPPMVCPPEFRQKIMELIRSGESGNAVALSASDVAVELTPLPGIDAATWANEVDAVYSALAADMANSGIDYHVGSNSANYVAYGLQYPGILPTRSTRS
jgi:hypothetical protein